MDRFLLGAILCGAGLAIVFLGLGLWRASRDRRAWRGAYLQEGRRVLEGARTALAITGFARMGGRYGGVEVDLQVVPDTLTFRKLPALWVLVTLPGALPLRATFDLMIRPTGVEPFSHFQTLPTQIVQPAGFPEDCAIRTDRPDALPDLEMLLRHMRLFEDPSIKELVLSPKGVRLVFLAEEAQRSRYLVYRDSEMGRTPLPAGRITACLEALLALRQDVLDTDRNDRSLPA